jgi:hypothetical protein
MFHPRCRSGGATARPSGATPTGGGNGWEGRARRQRREEERVTTCQKQNQRRRRASVDFFARKDGTASLQGQ